MPSFSLTQCAWVSRTTLKLSSPTETVQTKCFSFSFFCFVTFLTSSSHSHPDLPTNQCLQLLNLTHHPAAIRSSWPLFIFLQYLEIDPPTTHCVLVSNIPCFMLCSGTPQTLGMTKATSRWSVNIYWFIWVSRSRGGTCPEHILFPVVQKPLGTQKDGCKSLTHKCCLVC